MLYCILLYQVEGYLLAKKKKFKVFEQKWKCLFYISDFDMYQILCFYKVYDSFHIILFQVILFIRNVFPFNNIWYFPF